MNLRNIESQDSVGVFKRNILRSILFGAIPKDFRRRVLYLNFDFNLLAECWRGMNHIPLLMEIEI